LCHAPVFPGVRITSEQVFCLAGGDGLPLAEATTPYPME
jgi:hypothetical protein